MKRVLQKVNQRQRRGVSYIELMTAFTILMIGMSGFVPLVVLQIKQLKKISSSFSDGTDYYLTPSSDKWARKLGAAASITTEAPTAPSPPPVVTIDNGDALYTESVGSNWTTLTTSTAFRGDHRAHAMWLAGEEVQTASWDFTDLEPGRYEVLITWSDIEAGSNATNAPFMVYDGTIGEGLFEVNQQIAPVGNVFEGSVWQSLGVFPNENGTIRVELSNVADKGVTADGVRIVPVENDVQILSVDKLPDRDEMTVHVSVDLVN